MPTKFSKGGHQPDYFFLTLIFLLIVGGLVILASASSDLGKIYFNDSYYYLKHQILYGLSFGLIGFFFGSKIYYGRYRKIALPFLILTIGLVALVFTKLGVSAGGASRWLKLGPLIFQPAEILKLSFIIYIAAWLSNPKTNRIQSFYNGFLPFIIVSGLIAILLFLQPATSTVVILVGTAFLMYFLSGAKWQHILATVVLGSAFIALIIVATPYRFQRILSFLEPNKNVQGSNYQISQALLAIGTGGLWGVGYGQSANKVNYLPSATVDSIFAVAAQELGFAGVAVIIIVFALLTFRFLWLAKNCRDRFGQLILIGFGSIIAFQSIVNMASISGLIPLTGVPLPFVSYGGTALAIFLTMSGIAFNISKYI